MKPLIEQIQNELDVRAVRRSHIANIKPIGSDTDLISFSADGVAFWAKLTKTGKLKKHSIRIDN